MEAQLDSLYQKEIVREGQNTTGNSLRTKKGGSYSEKWIMKKYAKYGISIIRFKVEFIVSFWSEK